MPSAECRVTDERGEVDARANALHPSGRPRHRAFPLPTWHSTLGIRHSRGLGLIEMLTVLALLVVGLGFVVVTARHVRSKSATELTRKRVQALVDATGTLLTRGIDPTLRPPAAADGEDAARREATLADFAVRSSRRLAHALNPASDEGSTASAARPLVNVGVSVGVVGPPEILDAWDRPIALMPRPLADLGMAPDDGPFFVSAGADGRFLTLADNIYSYDLPALLPPLPASIARPATEPAGQGE